MSDCPNTHSAHIKQGEKESFDWALADVAVVLEQAQERVSRASIVLGAAAQAALLGATPLRENGHKVPIFEAVVRRTILQAAGRGV